MREWILSVISTYGYGGIFLMIALENLFPPIPSEIILTFGGFMTVATRMNIIGASTAATAGSLLGALFLYGLGKVLGQERLSRLIGKRSSGLFITQRDWERAAAWFERYQGKAVFFCRMVPLVRSLISVPAGMSAMPLGRFCVLTALGAFIWNTVLICCGAFLGENWSSVLNYLSVYSKSISALLAVSLMGGLLFFLKRKKKSH